MPDSPSGLTTNYSLKKYNDGDDPGAAALNSNLDTIDTELKSNSDAIDAISADAVGYTEFCALIRQAGTSVPTVTVLKNTTGATVLSSNYLDVGYFTIVMSSSVFSTSNSNGREIKSLGYGDEGSIIKTGYILPAVNGDTITLNTSDTNYTASNDLLTSTVNFILEIRTYP